MTAPLAWSIAAYLHWFGSFSDRYYPCNPTSSSLAASASPETQRFATLMQSRALNYYYSALDQNLLSGSSLNSDARIDCWTHGQGRRATNLSTLCYPMVSQLWHSYCPESIAHPSPEHSPQQHPHLKPQVQSHSLQNHFHSWERCWRRCLSFAVGRRHLAPQDRRTSPAISVGRGYR